MQDYLKRIFAATMAILIVIRFFMRRSIKSGHELLFFKGNRPKLNQIIGTIKELNIFPLKSCTGVSVDECEITKNGLLNDRLFMIVNKNGLPLTQRMIPQIALIKIKLLNDNKFELSYNNDNNKLIIDYIQVQNNPERKTLDLHGLKGECVYFSDKEHEWVNKALSILSNKPKTGYKLVSIAAGKVRNIHYSAARLLMSNSKGFDGTYLSDLAPLSVVSTASLNSLNRRIIEADIPIDRFRSNIVLDTEFPFLEDEVDTLKIGDVTLRNIGPTFRCVIPSVNQQTGEAGFRKDLKNAEPIATLKATRRGGLRFGITGLMPVSLGGSGSQAPLFGIYCGASLENLNSKIKVGDKISVVKYKKPNGIIVSSLYRIADFIGLGTVGF